MRKGSTVVRWSPGDIAFLTQNFNSQSDEEIAGVINRTPEAVQTKRMELKLIKDDSFAQERSKKTQYKKGNVPVITLHHLKKPRVDAWTDEQIAFLKANWETMTGEQMAEALKRTRYGVCSKACDLGLKKSPEAAKAIRQRSIGNIHRKDGWSKEHLQYLKDNWETQSNAEIAAAVNRTVAACKKMARKFGLYTSKETITRTLKKPNAGQYTASKIGDIVTRTNAKGLKTLWIKLGDKEWLQLSRHNWLKAGNALPQGCALRFIDGDTTNYAVENLMLSKAGRFSLRDRAAEKAEKAAKRLAEREAKRKTAELQKNIKKQERLAKAELRLAVAAQRIDEARALRQQLRDQKIEAARLIKANEHNERREQKSSARAIQDAKRNERREQRIAARAAREADRIEAKALKKQKSAEAKAAKEKPVKVQPALVERKKAGIKPKSSKPAVAEDPQRIKARETKRLVKAKVKAAKLHKEIQVQKELEQKKQFQTRQINYAELITVRIDSKTVIQVKPGTDIEALKAKYSKKPKEDWTNAYGHVPPQYEF